MKVIITVMFGVALTIFALFSAQEYIAGANTAALTPASSLLVNNLGILLAIGVLGVLGLIIYLVVK